MTCATLPNAAVTVVGVPEDGCLSLTSRAVNAVESARVIAGNDRLLDWFPQFKGERLSMNQGYQPWFAQVLEESEEGGVVVLASGDPLFFGIGQSILNKLPHHEVRFIPSPSSMQLACSRVGLPWQDMKAISLHGRKQHDDVIQGLASQIQWGTNYCLLTDAHNHPARIAAHLINYTQQGWQVWVCENLGSTEEKVTKWSLDDLARCASGDFSSLNVLILHRAEPHAWGIAGQYASDDDFMKRTPKRGLITKQPVRHLALSSMHIQPQSVVWDVGTGSGSVAIEAAKQCYLGQVFTIESNPECYESIEANLKAHGTDNIRLIKDKAPNQLEHLPAPDSIFVGGSRSNMKSILDTCWEALKPGGVIVGSAVTVDSTCELHQWSKESQAPTHVQLVTVSNGVPLAHYTRYQAENPIHLFTFTKPQAG
ncbi:bifunctional cobalt-precorrin-7 (C(5))-methyltransferase/cobalt-precorrin-6B (C(15))-methyltransferase [Vibrio nigripulchritudo]|uniref:bifunctional cobalt-precorrin-7 (C(5))-methyltransferase/cobalt-precorrin-6B (C(15))-methyltransferase n=1 Tax=Vibrio nigripulchritudo TaxID=28173 RepID=UPI0005F9BE12|nr:bifunctional cobalt-precorrin-7 (C(5))-methyltransferase/cobalt-precorrin-6B (C(15))-methyltransferase [Vibrio nigripulchritudo]KJY81331.1 precorrin-6Y-methylase [Vibrio nigripulchritudo]